jgi:alcohol dehydrogenase class IV
MAYQLEGEGFEVDGVKFGIYIPTITEAALRDHYLTLNPVMLTKQEVKDLSKLIEAVKKEGNKN